MTKRVALTAALHYSAECDWLCICLFAARYRRLMTLSRAEAITVANVLVSSAHE